MTVQYSTDIQTVQYVCMSVSQYIQYDSMSVSLSVCQSVSQSVSMSVSQYV